MKLGPTRSLSEVDSSLHLRPSSEILKKTFMHLFNCYLLKKSELTAKPSWSSGGSPS